MGSSHPTPAVPMDGSAKPRTQASFKTCLLAFGLIIVLPLTCLTGVLLWHAANVERDRVEARLVQLAKDLSEDIDRDIERHIAVLNTLATLPTLESGDFESFYVRATRALSGEGYIVLTDRDFNQVVNTFVPFGQHPTKTGDPDTVRRVLASGKPEVSDSFISLVTKGPVFNIDIPIRVEGEIRYVLAYGRPAEHLISLLKGQSTEPNWVSTIRDRKGTVLATTGGPASFDSQSGRVGPREPSRPNGGVERLEMQDGTRLLRATQESPFGWTASMDVPLSSFAADAQGSLIFWGLVAAMTLAATVILGLLFARHVARELTKAADAAIALGREEPILETSTSLSEVRVINEAISNARAELNKRMNHQVLLSRELNHRVRNVLGLIQAITKRTFSDDRPLKEARELMTKRLQSLGRSQDLLVKNGWTSLSLNEIVDIELAPFADKVVVSGPEIMVDEKNVQTFGLLLHELTTNAAKHGALAREGGSVSLSWRVLGDGPGARFSFRWRERCAHPVQPPTRQGLGTALLQTVFSSVGATPRMTFEPFGLVFDMETELASISSRAPPNAAGSTTSMPSAGQNLDGPLSDHALGDGTVTV